MIDLDGLAHTLCKHIINREYLETRHNTLTDDGLVGLLSTITVVLKHNPPFKSCKDGQEFLKQVCREQNLHKYNTCTHHYKAELQTQ